MAGGGETLLPVTVTTMDRPAGLLGDDEDEREGDEDDGDELADVDDPLLVVAPPASSADPPQPVTDNASASPAAYAMGVRSVIFVTNPSLDSAF